MALEARNLALNDEQQRLLILSREKFQRDQITMVNAAENKGRKEERRQILAHMLAKGLDEASIQEMTGLPLEEIKAITVD